MGMTEGIVKVVQECTDELLAIIVVGGTMVGYFVGVDIPSEPMIMVLGFHFLRKGIAVVKGA